ncbi:MAG: hypothetical protein FJY47_06310 [Betaproteobacteria bacterium]|nr:hypothetical protein [Betaproteobacteria bacterium]MBM3355436.1 hypothetical protein [Betaproteobacteria bacterium]
MPRWSPQSHPIWSRKSWRDIRFRKPGTYGPQVCRRARLAQAAPFAAPSPVRVDQGRALPATTPNGKGGAIGRLTRALDARLYRTLSLAAPTEQERAQP